MPFSYDMMSSNNHNTGKFMIDRNSIIFVFPTLEKSEKEKNISSNLPDELSDYVIKHDILEKMPFFDKNPKNSRSLFGGERFEDR